MESGTGKAKWYAAAAFGIDAFEPARPFSLSSESATASILLPACEISVEKNHPAKYNARYSASLIQTFV